MFRRCCGNALVCIYLNKFPIRISLNVIGIVRNLCLVAGELFLEIGGNSGVGSDFSACWSWNILSSCPIDRRRNDGYFWHFLLLSAAACRISVVQLSLREWFSQETVFSVLSLKRKVSWFGDMRMLSTLLFTISTSNSLICKTEQIFSCRIRSEICFAVGQCYFPCRR